MRKKTVVLCELCEEDRLAVSVVNWGLCGEHVEQVGGAQLNGHVHKPGRPAKAGKVRKPMAKKLHKRCGRMIDPRGWKRHVIACTGKV